MDYPLVVALIITYERTEIARQTIRGIKERVHYPNLEFHIADDGSAGNHVARLIEEIGPAYRVTVTNTGGHSVGKSMNLGITEILKRADAWLHWEDDWVPNMHFDLWPCIQLFHDQPDVGMVRLGRLSEGLYGQVIKGGDRLWWKLDKAKDAWTWVGHAAVRHRRFWDAYGPYKEGLTPGKTELCFQDKYNNTQGSAIVWPAWLRYDICDHIGDGYRFEEHMDNYHLTREQAAAKFNERMESVAI